MVIPQEEFEQLLEDLEYIRLFDEASKYDPGERILFSDYFKNRKK